jgi:flavin-dependent dehydrogenase
MTLPLEVDVLVIGAGPAGSTSAALLHRTGYTVCVLEREQFPRFQIGESLLPRCMDLLDEAGVLEAVRARGYLTKTGALFLRGDERSSFDFAEQYTRGWEWTWQVPRADFDKTLADTVASFGVPVFYRHTVTAIEGLSGAAAAGSAATVRGAAAVGVAAAAGGESAAATAGPAAASTGESSAPTSSLPMVAPDRASGPVVSVHDPDGHPHRIRTRFVIDASGYGRVLPRMLGLEAPSDQPLRQALFTHVRGDRRPSGPEEGRIWVCIHPRGGWIWIIPFSNGLTSVGIVAAPEFFADLPLEPEACLRAALAGEPNAAGRLEGVEFTFPPRQLKGYSASVTRVFGPGYCLVGNATEFLDPVFSSGVTLALESGNRAAKALIRSLRGEPVDWQLEYADAMKQGIDTFRTYVDTWYDGSLPRIFFAPEPNLEIKRQICSVLAGYVWDLSNPFVKHHARKVAQVARLIAATA